MMIQENVLPWNMRRYRKTDKMAFPQTMATILIKECTQHGTKTVACPVELLQLLINKTDENADSLFNQYYRAVLMDADKLFSAKPLAKRTFSNFLKEMCIVGGVKKKIHTALFDSYIINLP